MIGVTCSWTAAQGPSRAGSSRQSHQHSFIRFAAALRVRSWWEKTYSQSVGVCASIIRETHLPTSKNEDKTPAGQTGAQPEMFSSWALCSFTIILFLRCTAAQPFHRSYITCWGKAIQAEVCRSKPRHTEMGTQLHTDTIKPSVRRRRLLGES